MSDDTTRTVSENTSRYPFELAASTFVLLAALSQYSLGATYDKTGEQVRGGLPLATLVLALAVVATVVKRKRIDWPIPSWAHVTCLICMSIGLYGLHKAELKSGLKETIQVIEIFGLAWYLFATLSKDHHQRLFWSIGIIGIILIPLGIMDVHELKPFMLSDARLAALHLITIPFIVFLLRSRPPALAAVLAVAAIVDGLFLKDGIAFITLLILVPISLFLLSPKALWMGGMFAALAIATTFAGLLDDRVLRTFLLSEVKLAILYLVAIPLIALLLRRRPTSLATSMALAGIFSTLAIATTFVGWSEKQVWDYFKSERVDGYHKRLFVETVAATKAPSHYPAGGGLGQYKRTINQLKPLLNMEVSSEENKIPKNSNSQYLLTLVEAGIPAALTLVALFLTAAVMAFRYKGEDQANVVCALAAVGLIAASAYTTTLGRGVGIWTGAILGLITALTTKQKETAKESITRFLYPAVAFVVGFMVIVAVNKGEKRTDHVYSMNRRLRKALRLAPVRQIPKTKAGGLTIITQDGKSTPPENANIVRIEAEDFLSATGSLRKARANDASGNHALIIPLNSGKGTGQTTYQVTIPEAGTYLLRGRVQWEDGCSNSLRFIFDDQRVTLASEQFNVWHNVTGVKELALAKGAMTVIVENVEDGIQLDYFDLIPVNPPAEASP